jgi:RNA polymerase sigma-70 factor (ECF subfamily)
MARISMNSSFVHLALPTRRRRRYIEDTIGPHAEPPGHKSFNLVQRTSIESRATMNAVPTKVPFEQLALPLLPSLLSHATWLTHNPVEAEDLTQEALSKALRAFDSFDDGTNFKAWIFRILHNTFLTSRTALAASRTSYLEDQPELEENLSVGPTPEQTLIQLNDAANVRAALAELPIPLREILLLSDVQELKYREIASILDVPIGTVMSRISRARAALRSVLQLHFRNAQ